MDSDTDFSSDSDYSEFDNELLFVGDILQLFQFEPVSTAAEIQTKKDMAKSLTGSYIAELDAQPAH